MKQRYWYGIVLCSLVLAGPTMLQAIPQPSPMTNTLTPATSADEFVVESSAEGIIITGFNGPSTDVVIPATIKNQPVVAVAESAFTSTDITSVVIPGTVKAIAKEAFMWCSDLKIATLEEGVVALGEQAFGFCEALTTISLPSSLNTIGRNAFTDCKKLNSIQLNSGNSSFKLGSQGVLLNATGTDLIKAPATLTGSYGIPATVQHIQNTAFQHCTQLTGVQLPNGLKTIGEFAFSGSGLQALTMPNTLACLGYQAFQNCKGLTRENVTYQGILPPVGIERAFSFDALTYSPESDFTAEDVPAGKSITEYLGSATHVIIPKTMDGTPVVAISDSAFTSNPDLQTIVVPSSVQTIGKDAFTWCENLQEVILQHGVTTLGEQAFGFCSKLTTIHLPQSLHTIKTNAFTDCPELKTLDLDPKNTAFRIIGQALYNYTKTVLLKVPAKIDAITFTVPEGVTTISDAAFDGCTGLTGINLPQSLETIGTFAFKNCPSLTRLTIPAAVNTIPSNAFTNCTNLKTLCILADSAKVTAPETAVPPSVTTLYVPQAYAEQWQALYPSLTIQHSDAPENIRISIAGSRHVLANDSACYVVNATNTVSGDPLKIQSIAWKLVQAPADCSISPEGLLSVGNLSASQPLQLVAEILVAISSQKQVVSLQVKAIAPGTTVTPLNLKAGWNLVAPTFHLDSQTTEELLLRHPFEFDAEQQCYVLLKAFRPGVPFWIYSLEDQIVTMTGTAE